MATHNTGIFYIQNSMPSGPAGSFPAALRARAFSRVEPRFLIIFAICLFVIGGLVLVVSYVKPSTVVDPKQILAVQERYASIVLNQPVVPPKVEAPIEEKVASGKAQQEREGAAAAQKAQAQARANESVSDRQGRQAATRENRAAKRDAIGRQVASSGIFAAITSAGGSGGLSSAGGAADLLGTAGGAMGDLEGISISKGSFATASSSGGSGSGSGVGNGPRGSRVTGGDIQRQSIGTTQATQVAAVGEVNITTQAPKLTDESGADATTSRACIQSVVNRESSRLKRVYENWLKRDPNLGGLLELKFTILPSGAVTNVSVARSSTNNSEFDQNMMRYVQRWDFSGCAISGSIEVVYPFMFQGNNG